MGWFTAQVPFPDLVPELRDDVVRLRAHNTGDLARMVEEAGDAQTLAQMTVGQSTLADMATYLEVVREGWESQHPHPRWAICTLDDDTYLGTIVLRPHAWVGARLPAATVSYSLHPEARGRGLMTRALRLASAHFFGAYSGERLHWAAFRGNEASWRVARACGFTMHATIPQTTLQGERLRDDWVASLGRDEPTTPKTPWLAFPEICVDTAHGPVLLRDWRPSDVDALEPANHPEHYLPMTAIPPVDFFETWRMTRLEHRILGTGLSWCIANAEDRAMGYVTVFSRGGPIGDYAELGYYVFPSARGRGVVTAAAQAAVAHAFGSIEAGGLGVRRLVAMTTADNEASNRTLTTLGFTQFGREREVDVLPSGPVDLIHWDLLAKDR